MTETQQAARLWHLSMRVQSDSHTGFADLVVCAQHLTRDVVDRAKAGALKRVEGENKVAVLLASTPLEVEQDQQVVAKNGRLPTELRALESENAITSLSRRFERENDAAYDLWTWLPEHDAAELLYGDYSCELRDSNCDVMRSAARLISRLIDELGEEASRKVRAQGAAQVFADEWFVNELLEGERSLTEVYEAALSRARKEDAHHLVVDRLLSLYEESCRAAD